MKGTQHGHARCSGHQLTQLPDDEPSGDPLYSFQYTHFTQGRRCDPAASSGIAPVGSAAKTAAVPVRLFAIIVGAQFIAVLIAQSGKPEPSIRIYGCGI